MQFSEEEFNEILKVFESEVQENIQKINEQLLRLEKDNDDFYAVQELFREAHSIKGAARMVGFIDIQNLAHAFENVMGLKKNNELTITPEITDVLCQSVDCIENVIEETIKSKGAFRSQELVDLIEKLNNISNDDEQKIVEPAKKVIEEKVTVQEEVVEAKGDLQDVLTRLNNLVETLFDNDDINKHIIDILCVLKEMKSFALNEKALLLYEKLFLLLEKIKENNYKPDKDFFGDIKKAIDVSQAIINGDDNALGEAMLLEKRLIILTEIVDIFQAEPEQNPLEKTFSQPTEKLVFGNKENFEIPTSEPLAIKTLRVDAKKLDKLVNQVGELIIAKIKTQEHVDELEKISSHLDDLYKVLNKNRQYLRFHDKKGEGEAQEKVYRNMQSISDDAAYKTSELIGQVSDLYRIIQDDDTRLSLIVGDLENLIKGIRLLPFATVFHMFPRMVRDIARDKGKQAELIISGSETSADKKIIEEIKAPLVHIIRNAVDHGIEMPEDRIAQGKDSVGKIYLSAKHIENSIVLEIFDDGRGIDIDKIKKKVIEKNLLSEAELEIMTPSQIMNIIFWPGFSTEQEITDISGRGVGLDVVHAKISQLNGKVNIKSELGKKCVVTIQLPVTMATIKAFLIEMNNQKFAIGANSIFMVRRISVSEIFEKEGYKNIIYGDRTIPIFYLSDVLGLGNESVSDKVVVIFVKEDDTEVGFIVNNLLGEQEILHKNLAPPLVRVKNISGLATLASGEICLILNSSNLIKSAFNVQTRVSLPKVKNKTSFNPADYNVLLVEDSLTTRVLQRNILQNQGYNVDTMPNAEEAFKKVVEKKYDLIISDIEMPGMSGLEFMAKIKKEVPNNKRIKKMLVSFLDTDESRHHATLEEVDYFLPKSSFDKKEFIDIVKKLLKGAK